MLWGTYDVKQLALSDAGCWIDFIYRKLTSFRMREEDSIGIGRGVLQFDTVSDAPDSPYVRVQQAAHPCLGIPGL